MELILDAKYPKIYEKYIIGLNPFANTLQSITREHPQILHTLAIDIWLPDKTIDYLVRFKTIDDSIICISDYSGIRLVNMDLKILFELEIPKEKHYIDVYGFSIDIENNKISTWFMNSAQYILSELEKEDKIIIPEISTDEYSQLTRKQRQEYNNKLRETKYKIDYEIIDNVPIQCITVYDLKL